VILPPLVFPGPIFVKKVLKHGHLTSFGQPLVVEGEALAAGKLSDQLEGLGHARRAVEAAAEDVAGLEELVATL
jgi:hypothetical protein